jgi:4-amino-4-deoxy-L-arabinose transferase-like glycosyltransferase
LFTVLHRASEAPVDSQLTAETLPWRPDFSRRALINAIPLALVCLLPIILYLPFLSAPFERDEGTYATVAQGILDGQVPYRDLFDNKPPLVYGWYALSFLLFGEGVEAPRIVAALMLSVTTLALFAQARLMFSRGLAYIAAAFFSISTGVPFLALHANTEAYMLLPLVTSVVAFTVGMSSNRLPWFLAAGLLGALAIGTKQVAVWNFAALAIVALIWRWRSGAEGFERLTPLASLLAGAFLGLAIIAIPFMMMGALDELVYANVSYNWLYASFLSWGERLVDFGSGTTYVFLAAAPLLAGAVFGLLTLLRRRKRASDYLIIGWAVASAIGVASGGRFFPHYFLHLAPALALLTAVTLYDVLGGARRLPLAPPALLFGGLLVMVSVTTNAVMYLAPEPAERRVADTVFYQKEWEEASKALGLYIQERTSPGETIFNFGREPQIYFYADRRPAAQFFYDWAYQYDETTLHKTVDVLRLKRPAYIIDSVKPPLFPAGPRPAALKALLDADYEYVGSLYFADIYKLKKDSLWQPSEFKPFMP